MFDDMVLFLASRGELRGGEPDEILEQQLRIVTASRYHACQRTRTNGVRIDVTTTPLPCGGFVRHGIDITDDAETAWRLEAATRQLRERTSNSRRRAPR